MSCAIWRKGPWIEDVPFSSALCPYRLRSRCNGLKLVSPLGLCRQSSRSRDSKPESWKKPGSMMTLWTFPSMLLGPSSLDGLHESNMAAQVTINFDFMVRPNRILTDMELVYHSCYALPRRWRICTIRSSLDMQNVIFVSEVFCFGSYVVLRLSNLVKL